MKRLVLFSGMGGDKRMFGPCSKIMIEMARGYSPKMLRRFGRMIVEWRGVESFSGPMLAVHGREDRILPPSFIDAPLVLPAAGHAFTLTHPEPIGSAIRDFVQSLA